MKRIFLALLLMISQAIGQTTLSVGQILDIDGSISGVQADRNTLSIGSKNYAVDDLSAIVIDGKRGTIHDLVDGMKVTGSAEVTLSGDKEAFGTVMMIKILNATSLPASAHGTLAPAVDLKQKLAGTFWRLRRLQQMPGYSANAPQPTPAPDLPEQWMCLNADGTVTCGWLPSGSTWVVRGIVILITFSGDKPTQAFMGLDPALLSGLLTCRYNVAFGLERINEPTQEMLEKVPPSSVPPVTAAATPTPALPSPETQNAAAEVIQANHGNLVFVTGKDGAGSGFIGTLNGANFLITNAHVAAGINNANFRTMDGTAVKGGAAEVAVGHDIFCMSLPAVTGKPFEIMQGVDANAKIGDDVVVLGNADGAGVINTIMGKIVGIGPSLVEADAQFIPGNSGSPIVHIKTGKVIGVATYLVIRKYDATTHEKMATPEVHRYGYRIDSVKTWQPVNWQTFYANADAMEKIHTLTAALDDFFRDLAEYKGKVTPELYTNPVIKYRIAQWQEDKKRGLSSADRRDADANFLSFLKIACQSDINAVQRRLSYDYFQRELTDEQETRTEMSKAFTEIIQDIQK